MTSIEDANLPSKRGKFITEVKGHYRNIQENSIRKSTQELPATV
jgi:hypothetical protein